MQLVYIDHKTAEIVFADIRAEIKRLIRDRDEVENSQAALREKMAETGWVYW